MQKKRYSAQQLCEQYPGKYIAVNHITKNEDNIIVSAEVLKVYDTLDDCKQSSNEIQFFMKLYQEDLDIIYGDYEDYVFTRKTLVINAFQAFGAFAFEMANPHYIDDLIAALDEANKKSRRNIL